MIKDRVIWGVCVGLFLTGGLFAYAFSGGKSDGFKIVDLFAIVSAIATAFAAFAAWSAASAAQKQSFDSAVSIRRQTHRTHVESFNEWLDGMESELDVKFYRRYELYEIIFPNNRNPAFEFSEVGDSEVEAWQKSYATLADLACNPSRPGLREVESWVAGLMFLTGFMRCSILSSTSVQIFLDNRIPSGISFDNYKRALPVLGIVLSSLSKFAFIERSSSNRGMSSEFELAFSEFVQAVMNSSWNQHSYRAGAS
ncbi:hypothetical protein I4N56_009590 [Pseudomonas mohnii]|uniref:hypothetical protein n=1 Tax=Pseudomonas mohnii TaxID=395600 RepID=UPI0018DC0481|nr:hypothetical protein [Pseudomonas mohnii]MBH8611164.1 hypothetical protein [Pseudomonas mohnii]